MVAEIKRKLEKQEKKRKKREKKRLEALATAEGEEDVKPMQLKPSGDAVSAVSPVLSISFFFFIYYLGVWTANCFT